MTNTYLERNFTEVDFNPFADGKEIEKTVAINEPQREIWLSCMLGGDAANLAYNESVSLDLHGTFNTTAFTEAAKEVVARHEALRATVSTDGETLIIYKNIPFTITTEDISLVADQDTYLQDFIAKEMLHVFDLQEGPLLRAFLHKLNHTHYYFTIVAHHIACDGWSIGVILEDISKIYNAKVKHVPVQLGKADQISDYAVEMTHFKQNGSYQQVKKYWLDMYKDSIPVIDFPTDYPRPAIRSYKAQRIDQVLPQKLVDQLKNLGVKSGISLVNTLLSAFEIFLYLKTNDRDIVVGIASSGQAATGNFNLVGHCVNILSLRSRVEPDLSFSNYVTKRKGAFLDAYENQNFTYGELVKSLNFTRDTSRIPLSPIAFNVDLGMDSGVSFDDLTYSLISNPRAYEAFELFLNVTSSRSSFILEWSYNTQLFKASTITQLSAEFEQLLQTIVDNPAITIKELSDSKADLYKEKIVQWNNTQTDYQKDNNLFELIEEAAAKYPDKIAFTFKDESLTYTRLVELANQLAAHLIASGVKVGDIAGLAVDRSTKMIVSMLGILKAGAVYVPLDPEYPQDRIEFMLADSDTKVLLISKAHEHKFKSNATQIVIEDIWDKLNTGKETCPPITIKGTDLVYILYTSGSTGKPKGVKVRHFNLINFLTSMRHTPGITNQDRLLAITTISFDISAFELFVPLVNGAQIILSDKEASGDPRILLEMIEKDNISIMITTPSTWMAMIDVGWTKKYPLKVLCGGEALPKNLADRLIDLSSEVWNNYGPTETTACTTLKRIYKEDDAINIGWPIDNAQVYILNDANELVAPGTIGEIFIGGDGVTAGYLNRPELTNERFIDNPFSKIVGAKMYKTGDLGKFTDNGDIQYFGRSDHQVKIRGLRIELGEIESILAEQNTIKQAVVLAVTDTAGESRLVAYIVLKQENNNTKSLIDNWKETLRQKLPTYMVPNNFVIVETIPLTANNKIDNKALQKMQPANASAGKNASLPVNQSEQLIFDVWKEILGLQNINTEDDFFEIGGHSLLAVKMMSTLEKHIGKRLPLATLFENSTIKTLALKISLDESEAWETLVPIKSTGTKTPVYLIHGGGLNILLFKSISKYFDADQPVYGIQAFGLTKDTPVPTTIEEAAKRHIEEILQNNTNGPYALAGYSLGGYIAFEMAKQLKNMGKEVVMLGIIDTYADLNLLESKTILLSKKFKRQFKKIPFFTKSFLAHPIESIAYQFIILKYKVQKLFAPDYVIAKEVLTARETEIYKIYENAYSSYILEPLDLKITLFRVSKRLYFLDDLVYLGWNKFTTKEVDIREVPGDHKTFLYPPYDKEFAQVVQKVLDKQAN